MPSLFAGDHLFADIILPLSLPKSLTYGVPFDLHDLIKEGMSVEVSLGKNKYYSGIVERLHRDKPDAYEVKPIRKILDEEPLVNEVQLRFWKWIAQYYMAAPGEVMQAALPAHLKLAGETRIVWAPQKNIDEYNWSHEAFLAAEALEQKKELLISELRALAGSKHFSEVLRELLEQEAIIIQDNLEQTYRPKKEKIVLLHPVYKAEKKLEALFHELNRAPKQLELLMAYIELSVKNSFVKQTDLLERTGATSAQIRALTDKNIFIVEERDTSRLVIDKTITQKEIVFTPAQQAALGQLEARLKQKDVVLLEGVTGSGKTLLYIDQLKKQLQQGKQALLLLPEIALTTQLVSRLYAYFGEELGVYHSRFNNNERVEIWEKVRKGSYKIVAGPRSALWLPFDQLGLIIVDEEHDGSYKQKDPAPRFHARDAAIYLASLHQAKTILGSATPSVESLFNAQQEKYAHVVLKERYLGVNLPEIQIVNAKSLETMRQQGIRLITPEMAEEIKITLQQKKQVILFQNRRGYAPFQICTVCGWVPQCKNCAVSLTYHKSSDKLHCHYCGLKSAVIHTCLNCGSHKLHSKTFGTEKIEEEVQQLFPEARVARMDTDSMRSKNSLLLLLEKMEKQKLDVLVGTQMVVKGLDLSSVSLVGVLSADSLLSYPDFRVNERAFQLMEQVSGRAGRTDGAGKVLIQAYNLQHPVLHWVTAHDLQAFYEQEIKYRHHFAYPPFTRLIKISFRHKEEIVAIKSATQMAETLATEKEVVVQGPVAAIVHRVRNQYIQEVWVKCPRDMRVIEQIKTIAKAERDKISGQKGNASLQIIFDVDPV